MLEKRDRRGRTEAEAIAAYQAKAYPKPALTADVALFTRTRDQLKVLLVRRGNHPYLGCWALPGGFANPDEAILDTAFRELREETGAHCDALQLVGVYSQPGRDPRGWVVSVAYTAFLEDGYGEIRGADDADDARWIDIRMEDEHLDLQLPDGEGLAFDHETILHDALHRNLVLTSARDILEWLRGEMKH